MDYILQLATHKKDLYETFIGDKVKIHVKKIIDDTIKGKHASILTNDIQIDQRYDYTIYTSIPLRLSNTLANNLVTYTKYVRMATKLYLKEYEVNVNNEINISIIMFIPMYDDISYKMSTNILNSILLKELYIVYNFYTTSSKNTLQLVLDSMAKNITGVNTDMNKYGGDKNTFMKDIYNTVIQCDVLLLSHIKVHDNYVFNTPINIIYKNEEDYHNIIKECDKLCKKLGYTLKTIKHNNFYIPHDFRLKKTTLLVTKGDISFYVINFYNSGTYEIIPIKNNTILKIVMLRFMFLDMYFLENNKSAYVKLSKQVSNLLPQAIEESEVDINTIEWFGYCKDENYEKIKINGKNKCFPYYPNEYKILHNKLRVL